MVGIIELLVYLATEMLIYLLAYSVVFEMEVDKSIKKWIFTLSIIFAIHIAIYYVYSPLDARGASSLSMLFLVGMLIKGQRRKKFLLYPIIIIGVASLVVGVSFAVGIILNIPEYSIVESSRLTILCQIVPIILMFILLIYRKIKKYEKIQLQMDFRQYLIFYVCIIATYVIMSALQMISEFGMSEKYVNHYGLATSLVCVVMVLLIVWQSILLKRELQYKKQNEMYNLYMKMQEDRVKEAIEHDEKLRRFRHDLKNHFTALNGYASEGDLNSIKKYLFDMTDDVKIYEYKDYTGNKALDAIIRQSLEQAKELNIEMKIVSTSIVTNRVAIFDLCTIVSNLLKNAIEACEKISCIDNRKIDVSVCSYESKIVVLIKNTFDGVVDIKNGKLVTTKEDNVNHGLGLGNVERTVKKYDGSIEFECKEGLFEVEIIL